jgi:alanine racemase
MISLYDLLEAANGQLFGEPAAQLFTAFCLDSHLAEDNHIYVTRKTDQGDTHQFIREAIERGARGVLCTDPPHLDTSGISVIIVKDTEAALMSWARYILKKLGTRVIAVTGSSGKSVTVEAINQVLSTRYRVHTSPQVQGGRLRLPLALASLKAEHNMVLLELGAAQPGDMAEMVQTLQPEVGVVTHVGYAYTNAFETLEQIAREEGLLVEYLPVSGLAVLNYDDDLVRKMSSRTRARVMTVGTADFGADFMAYNILVGPTKTGFDLRHSGDRFVGRWSPLLGKHQLYSVLSALAVGVHYDVMIDDGLKVLTEMRPLPGRMNPLLGMNGSLLIDDTYDATPQSTLFALDWLRAVGEEGARRIFIMGDMGDLGAFSQRGHRMIGQRAADMADLIVTEGGDASLVGRAALDQGMDRRLVVMTYSAQDATAVFTERFPLQSHDIVLIKGGKSAHMEVVTQSLLQDEHDRSVLVRQDGALKASAQPLRTTWVEIDKRALAHNTRLIKERVGANVTLMAVVKADAYGHGAVAASITALANGAEALGVASLNEALELRDAGVDAPILVMSYTPVYAVRQAIRSSTTLTLYDLDLAQAYNQAAREVGGKLRVHIKIDTGMGRLGVRSSDGIPFFRHLANLNHLELEGIYTHFAMADEDSDYTSQQLRTFKSVLNPVRASGFNFKYIHAANSAAVLTQKEDTFFNMVRVGIALYGLSPSETVRVPSEFQPVMAWKTVVAQVKTLPAEHPVGYGEVYTTQGEERIAVLPVGYAYGFRRTPYNWGEVLIHGQVAPIIGNVAMEKAVVNVTHIPNVAIGDEVVLLGKQEGAEITADDIARRLHTNNYEVVCSVMARIPRR